MVELCKRFYENKADWKNIIYITKIEIGQDNKAIHTEEWWIVQNRPRQQIMKMFGNYRSAYGDERIAWRTIKVYFATKIT